MIICVIISHFIDTTIIAGLIAALVSYFVAQYTYRGTEFQRLDGILFQLNSLAMEYPYLENETFINSLNKNYTSNDDAMRYETYCIMWFNFLERTFDFYKGNKKEIENFVQVKEIIRLHRDFWETPTGTYTNIDGYNENFRKFINQYLK
jgi:hypothetical protein